MAEIASFGVNVDQNTKLAQNAQDTADEANKKNSANSQQIANINDPNYLTPFEKPQLEIQMDNFAAIYKTDKDIAKAEGIDFTTYDAAYQAYLDYMTPLVADMTKYSPIVRSTFNSMVTAVQAEQKRFNTATQAQYNQQISKAQTDINDGRTKYKALQSEAETMKSSVAGISDAADRAISSAGFASNAASTASQAANEASQTASSALVSAINAQDDASSAVAKAELTASNFGPVSQKADSAFANAASAQASANSAVTKAESTALEFGKVSKNVNSAVASAASAESNASSAVAQASSAAADSKDAKQIAGAVSQSYKTLTDGSTMTIAELENGLAAKLTKTDLDGYATQTWTQNKIKVTADDISGNLSSVKKTVDGQTTSINDLKADSSGFKSQFTKVNNTLGKQNTDIGTLQATSKSLSANFDSLSSDNKTNQHDIGQLQASAKGFSSTLETVQTQVDNSAVGTNLVTNSKFSGDSLADWVVDSGITTSFDSSGNLVLDVKAASGNRIYYSGSQPLIAGMTYAISFYACVDSSSTNSSIVMKAGPYDNLTSIPISGTTLTRYAGIVKPVQGGSGTLTIAIGAFNSGTVGDIVHITKIKLEKGSLATDWCPNPADTATVTALTKVKRTADSVQVLANNNQGDIAKLQVTAKGLQSTISDKVSSDQLTQLSGQLTNKIKDLSSSTSSKFTQTFNDINDLVKKGDVVNQFNIDAGGDLLSTTGNSTKIVFSSPNIIFDSKNPVQIPNANIPGTLTGKTFEAGTITATTKIISSDIEASLIHSKDNSFSLNGATGDIVGPSIHAADNSWGISNAGKIHGTSIAASVMDISGDGKGPNFDAVNVTPDTTQGIYSRYKYSVNSGYDVNKSGRTLYKNGYLVINGDTFLNRAIGDWSADGGGKYVYDTMYEAHTIKMRAYNYTGSNVQTDDPSKTQGGISSRLDIQPSAITMGRDWSVGNPNILIDGDGLLKVGTIAINGHHSMGTIDDSDMYFMKMNKNATDVSGASIPIHAARYYTANMGISGGHVINSYDGGDVYLEDKWGSGGNTVSLHVKKLYNSSLLSLKTDITTIDPNDALETIANTDFRSYRFKTDDPSEPKSVSPILDDENQIPKYNTPNIFKSADGKSRNDGNILGYTALSVQALYAKIKDLTARLQKLEGVN